jgi:DNA invertase Pin-like site-specific DNA recombinase
MRAVIYARFSSEQQRDASIEDQIRDCRAFIERNGWQYLSAYHDRAVSGASALRPGYQVLQEDARHRKFDIVVAEALDRLSRDQEDTAGLFKRLRFAGVRIVTLAEGEISELQVGFKGTMNAVFLKDLADKTRRGLRGRVEAGCSSGNNAYGYDVVRAFAPNGEPLHGERAINEDEAAVVRRIFSDYAAGRSPLAIARQLNAEGVPGPRGAPWGKSTVNGSAGRGTGILNNELYVGRLVWNRLRYVKDPETGKRISRPNPPEQWVVTEVPALRIVPQDLWDRARARQQRSKRDTRPDAEVRGYWDRRRPRFLLSGLMRCGQCGGSYTVINRERFGCAAARDKGAAVCTNKLTIRRDVLEAAVLDGLKRHLMQPDLFKEFTAEFHKEVNRQRREQFTDVEAARAELAQIARRQKTLVALITEDDAPVRAIKDELRTLEARQGKLERLLSSTAAEPQPYLHPNLAEVYRQKVAALHVALEEPSTKDEAFTLIRSLIEAIVLVPEGAVLRIELKGELAGILRLAADSKKPSRLTPERLEQIKAVAGARLSLCRTRPKKAA